MPRKFFRKVMPNVEKVREIRAFSMFGDRLFHPALWHLNRRSAAGGVAVGLFCGLIPGPLQMLGAGIACLVFRVNLPLALVTTLYTNPVTIVPLYVIAYKLGSLALGESARHAVTPPPEIDWSNAGQWVLALTKWAIGLGPPLALGVLLLACLLAVLGYVVVRALWSAHLRRAWYRRRAARSAQAGLS
jgi:uncharacterized protein (DUF2062 family)